MCEWHWHVKHYVCLSLHCPHGNPQVWITELSLCPSFHPEINQTVWKCHEMEKHRLMKLTNKLYILHIHDHKIKIYREKNKLPDDFSNVYKNARLTCFLTSVLTCTTFPGSGKGLPNAADSNSLARSTDLCRRSSAASNNCNKQ